LIINIPTHYLKRELEDGFIIRRRAVDLNIPLLTNLQIVSVFIESLASRTINDLKAKEWGEY
jgi:carbamoyl-phosphate synthase large subunit